MYTHLYIVCTVSNANTPEITNCHEMKKKKLKISNKCINYGRNIVQTDTQLIFDTKNMHSFGDAE